MVGWNGIAYVSVHKNVGGSPADSFDGKVALGETFNFAAYAFAPAILVTPLGALSVLIGYVKRTLS